jgi:probable phosphoglycerate mutase
MEIIRAELLLPPRTYCTDARLLEMSYGEWEGQLLSELPSTDPQGVATRSSDAWHWA